MKVRYVDLVARIMSAPGPVRLVAVDGPGGSGKSTFAARLARAAGGAPVVPTDDFASWDDPLGWWPRLRRDVVEPLVAGRAARYQRYDWGLARLAEWRTVPPSPIVVIEGVSAGRREWAEHLSVTVWIETPREVRLARGLTRDGVGQADLWAKWMADEDAHYAADGVADRADVVVDGCPSLAHDADDEFVVVAGR